MSDPPRDWDRELAKIDRAMARLPEPAGPAPAGPQPGGTPGDAPTSPPPAHRPVSAGAKTATWLRVVLVLVLALAMPLWPYGRGCGVGLFIYLSAVSVLLVGGLWAAVSTWQRRRPVGHVLALLIVAWGLGLLAGEVLPRAGYAKHELRWTCG